VTLINLGRDLHMELSDILPRKKKKKKLHHSSHIRLIRWTLPVSRDIGEHNEQAESTSVCSVQEERGLNLLTQGDSEERGRRVYPVERCKYLKCVPVGLEVNLSLSLPTCTTSGTAQCHLYF